MKRVHMCILILIMLAATACGGAEATPEPTPIPTTEEPEVYYTIIVKADPTKGGAVAPSRDEVLAGTMIQVQAVAAPGFVFTGWSGDISLSSPEVSLTMDSDKLLTAHFNQLATDTPLPPTVTPTPQHSPTPEEEEDGVCSLTKWCQEHVGCENFEVRNQSPFAIGIYLRHEDTNISCEYYVSPKGNLQITLRPGRYYYIFTTCNGKYVYEGYHHLSAKWIWLQKEKFCK